MSILPFTTKGASELPQNDPERDVELGTRSIRLPNYVWKTLDEDAKRCRRSPVRQMEAILVRYYNLDANIELNEEALNEASDAVSHKPRAKKAA